MVSRFQGSRGEAESPNGTGGLRIQNLIGPGSVVTNLRSLGVGPEVISALQTEEDARVKGSSGGDESSLDDLSGLFQKLLQVGQSVGDKGEYTNIANSFYRLGDYWMTQFKTSGEIANLDRAVTYWYQALLLTQGQNANRGERLNSLAELHIIRFQRLEKLADLDRAIEYHTQATLLIPDDHKAKPRWLSNLGISHRRRYHLSGRRKSEDIDRSIECHSQAVSLAPREGIDKPRLLNSLGLSHQSRFQQFSKLEDIDQAIALQSQALLLTPDGHPEKLVWLYNLGDSHQIRFEHFGDLADIDKAITYQSQALLLTSDRHEDKPRMLGNTGHSHFRRFEHLGRLEDIDQAITYQSQALALTSYRHKERPEVLSKIGNSYCSRFECLGKLEDMNRAIEYHSQAVLFTPDGHPNKPRWLSNLGMSHKIRFGRLGKSADIDQAIAYDSQALFLTPDGHADKRGMLGNLGNSYRRRFEHLGGLEYIDQAIKCHSQALLLTPNGHADMPGLLSTLSSSHERRFEHLGELVDIDQAIEFQSQALLITPDGHESKPGYLCNLGNSHHLRFQYLGDIADIDKAIAYQSQALLSASDWRIERPKLLNNLGSSHTCRFEHLGELADIDQAIECRSLALLITPDGHPDKPGVLTNLGNSHCLRFQKIDNLADMEQAITYQSQAVSLTPDGHANKPTILNNLGGLYHSLFDRLNRLVDIDQAIARQSQALSLVPDGYSNRAEWLMSLGSSHECRFKHLGQLTDIHQSISFLRMAAVSTTGKSSKRFQASMRWARLAGKFEPSTSLTAYRVTMQLVPKVAWIGATVGDRYKSLRTIGSVAVEAAAAAISAGKYGLALEWLEEGRSIVWNQTLLLRTQFDDLSMSAPELARILKRVSHDLEHAGQRNSSTGALADSAQDLEAAAQKHRRLAEQYDELLQQARELPGFHDFMRPKQAVDLSLAARSGPVVILNVHTEHCDALILRPHTTEIAHVPLPDISHAEVSELQRQMLETLHSKGVRERGFRRPEVKPVDRFEIILATLWHKIAKPVLHFLGFTVRLPVERLPHITWCTTGALSFLPIHAAGCYDQIGNNIFDFAISSYTPTLSSVLPSSSHSFELGGVLAVSQEATPGCTPLPGTKTELAHIRPHAKSIPYIQLENENATTKSVLEAMEKYGSVHLACHASQNLDQPIQSCFYLHNGGLTLAEIAKRSLKKKGMAFLSACQTAAGDKQLPDEAIHLAAGMLVAGYPTVIATLWSINDGDAPLIADQVYGQLTKDGRLDAGKAARALHNAVGVLRERVGANEFTRWVPYVHIGI